MPPLPTTETSGSNTAAAQAANFEAAGHAQAAALGALNTNVPRPGEVASTPFGGIANETLPTPSAATLAPNPIDSAQPESIANASAPVVVRSEPGTNSNQQVLENGDKLIFPPITNPESSPPAQTAESVSTIPETKTNLDEYFEKLFKDTAKAVGELQLRGPDTLSDAEKAEYLVLVRTLEMMLEMKKDS